MVYGLSSVPISYTTLILPFFMGVGIYSLSNMRKVPVEELEGAKMTWRDFLVTLLEHIQTIPSPSNTHSHTHTHFAQAIREVMKWERERGDSEGEARGIAEIHQVWVSV